jgi:hypothetical protein
MSIPDFQEVDFLEEARLEVTQQFKDKVVFDRYLQLLMDEQYNLQAVMKQLLQMRSIDEAIGEQLDIIGRIVGQDRELIQADLYNFFCFLGFSSDGLNGFSSLTVPGTGAPFYSSGTPSGGNVLLDDNSYRLFIKAKILKNNTASTPEEFLDFVSFLFGEEVPAQLTEGTASFTLLFGRVLSKFERVLLTYTSYSNGYPSRLIPKTLGVKSNFGHYDANNVFAFQGVPNAKGFGDEDVISGYGYMYGYNWGTDIVTENIGGYFATEY